MQSMTLAETNTTHVSTSRNQTTTTSAARRTGVKADAALWILQGVLAAAFLFTGATKLAAPGAAASSASLPAAFMAFVGLCEVLGAAGLILPGLTRIHKELTPLAAAGLVVIMIGATIDTVAVGGGATALMPFVVGLVAVFVTHRRWQSQS